MWALNESAELSSNIKGNDEQKSGSVIWSPEKVQVSLTFG